ncbi:hypothetical protein AIG75_003677 [Salmonella enterica subsp. enterica serovar Pomona]|nr:hypothetical protein [Salmonella enterica subsp. enterica serovar Pomona]MIE87069.1 hypothetical protein [Salmonella enterica subsp. enterica serovar Pomona]
MPETFICIASGPSLTAKDCQLLPDSGYPIIAVNSSWVLCPKCHHIYAADFGWWEKYHGDIPSGAQRWTSSVSAAHRYGLNYFPHTDSESFNSGLRAIELATALNARRILLVGYDCSLSRGIHWHGPHTGLSNPTPDSVAAWHREYGRTAAALAGVEVINCSRYTELEAFPYGRLEDYL